MDAPVESLAQALKERILLAGLLKSYPAGLRNLRTIFCGVLGGLVGVFEQ
jgi:hypothetical protein